MSKKITWKKTTAFQILFWTILLSTIVNVVLIAIFIENSYKFSIPDNFDGTIITILTILGVFIAFTAINIYSVFNARVMDEQEKLEEVKEKCHKEIAKLEDTINNHNKKMDGYKLNAEIYDVKHGVVVLERVRAIYALTERIEKIKASIDTDSIRKKEKSEQELLSLKNYIKQNISTYYPHLGKIKNDTFQGILNDFKTLLGEALP